VECGNWGSEYPVKQLLMEAANLIQSPPANVTPADLIAHFKKLGFTVKYYQTGSDRTGVPGTPTEERRQVRYARAAPPLEELRPSWGVGWQLQSGEGPTAKQSQKKCPPRGSAAGCETNS